MRHAKAEQVASSDMERALADRGRAQAADAGRWLAGTGFEPDHVLVSSALRARETWEAVAEAAGWSLEPEPETGLYAAGPDAALDLVRLVPGECRSLMVIGHNPTVGYLAQLLSDGTGDEAAASEMTAGYPTCALTLFSYDGAWAELELGTARVEAFHVGRG
jgi:phosphohistidine phosphatase